MSTSHDCAWAEAVLLGEAPAPTGIEAEAALKAAIPAGVYGPRRAQRLDVLASTLPDLVVPPELSHARTGSARDRSAAPRYVPLGRSSASPPAVVVGVSRWQQPQRCCHAQGHRPRPPSGSWLVAAAALPTVSLKMAVQTKQD